MNTPSPVTTGSRDCCAGGAGSSPGSWSDIKLGTEREVVVKQDGTFGKRVVGLADIG